MGALLDSIVAALVLLIPMGAAVAGKAIYRKLSENNKLIEQNTAVTLEVKKLVDGTRGMLLQRLADTLSSVSRLTGNPEDEARAETARVEAQAHGEALLREEGQTQYSGTDRRK